MEWVRGGVGLAFLLTMIVVGSTECHRVGRGWFGRAGLVSYPLERIPGGPGDKWTLVRMVGAWYR